MVRDLLHVASTTDEFARAVLVALTSDHAVRRERRPSCAARHDWTAKAGHLLRALGGR